MKHIQITNQTIAISRTDSIGDVVLTLPAPVWLKKKFPAIKIIFFGSTYTKPVIECLLDIEKVEQKIKELRNEIILKIGEDNYNETIYDLRQKWFVDT